MKKEILNLASALRCHGLDAYIVMSADYHCSEEVHPYFAFRQYLTGFTGSNGTLVVVRSDKATSKDGGPCTGDEVYAFLITDSRYYIQAKAQLDGSGIKIVHQDGALSEIVMNLLAYKATNKVASESKGRSEAQSCEISNDTISRYKVGIDMRTISAGFGIKLSKLLEAAGGCLVDADLSKDVWSNDLRPMILPSKIFRIPERVSCLPDSLSTETATQKLAKVKAELAGTLVLASLDNIAWLLNLRGNDIAHAPLFYSYMTISKEKTCLYVMSGAMSAEINNYLDSLNIIVKPYEDFYKDIDLFDKEETIHLSESETPYKIYNTLSSKAHITQFDLVTTLKCIKNKSEIYDFRAINEVDGAVMVKFIYWLKQSISNADKPTEFSTNRGDELAECTVASSEKLTEFSVAKKLDELRVRYGAAMPSFDSIVAYGANGAIVHYEVSDVCDCLIKPCGFLLVDSGGQYLDINGIATTDITRTISLGNLTDEMKENYTRVLKGMIDLSMSKFESGLTGRDIDGIAHAPLREINLDYYHGTGHGIGCGLCVHENGVTISPASETVLSPGMITSCEPGIYLEGKYGIRIENDLLVKAVSNDMLGFETLTLCPFEKEAIIKSMLTDDEIKFINAYHERVYEECRDSLSREEADWLYEVTRPL